MQEKLLNIKNEALAQIINAKDIEELEDVRVEYFSKSSGKLTMVMKKLSELSTEEKVIVGRFANEVKKTLEDALESQEQLLGKQKLEEDKQEIVDITIPGKIPIRGRLHPTTIVFREMNEIFKSLGFSVAEGPELETEEFNFLRLNLPPDHPARDLQDTLYIKDPGVLLRTHTSSIESRILLKYKPPFRFVIPGKAYRFENVNASNNIMFTQYEGIAVGEGISMADLKGTLNTFIKMFFGENRKTRFRCKYYPQVEPGVGVDIDCPFCNQKGCNVCKYRGWIEMLGAGMVHPNMLRMANLDPEKYSGFAWGMGSDRIVMDRFKINDVRALYGGDIMYD